MTSNGELTLNNISAKIYDLSPAADLRMTLTYERK